MADNKDEKEIDLLELARKLWDNRKFIIKVTLIGAVVGLVIALSIPKEYTSTVVFTTNSNDAKSGNMGALASLAGINLGNMQSSDVFSPELYPDVIVSTPFVKGLFKVNVKDSAQGVDTTLYSYLKDEIKRPWWSYVFKAPNLLLSLFKSEKDDMSESISTPHFISEKEMKVIDEFRESYNIKTDKKTGITTFEITTQSPVISAFLADTITSYLQSYIISERTKKAKTDLENTEKIYKQSKKEYLKTQEVLAAFLDGNRNIISAKYEINQKTRENDVSLAYSVYSQMAQQLQIYEMKVQDDTPMFTIIQPSIEPLFSSKPNKGIIIDLI